MTTHLLWFVVVLGAGLTVVGSVWIAGASTPPGGSRSGLRTSGTIAVGSALVLVFLALLYRVHAVARADARVVARLVPERKTTLDGLLSIVTTMGDLVPSFIIAGILEILVYRRTTRWTAWLLPLVVLVQVAIQTAFLDTFRDPTIAQIAPGITLGASDGIPSGSMARLLSVFLVAALLWRPVGVTAARRLTDLGAVLVFVELITRVYLARHFLADIVGGLLLGIVLTTAFGWLVYLADHRVRSNGARGAHAAGTAKPATANAAPASVAR